MDIFQPWGSTSLSACLVNARVSYSQFLTWPSAMLPFVRAMLPFMIECHVALLDCHMLPFMCAMLSFSYSASKMPFLTCSSVVLSYPTHSGHCDCKKNEKHMSHLCRAFTCMTQYLITACVHSGNNLRCLHT